MWLRAAAQARAASGLQLLRRAGCTATATTAAASTCSSSACVAAAAPGGLHQLQAALDWPAEVGELENPHGFGLADSAVA
jgi:hypothetical protein